MASEDPLDLVRRYGSSAMKIWVRFSPQISMVIIRYIQKGIFDSVFVGFCASGRMYVYASGGILFISTCGNEERRHCPCVTMSPL